MLVVSKHDDFQEYYWLLPFYFHCYYPRPTAVNGFIGLAPMRTSSGQVTNTGHKHAHSMVPGMLFVWPLDAPSSTRYTLTHLMSGTSLRTTKKCHDLIDILIDVWWPTPFSSNFPTAPRLCCFWQWCDIDPVERWKWIWACKRYIKCVSSTAGLLWFCFACECSNSGLGSL